MNDALPNGFDAAAPPIGRTSRDERIGEGFVDFGCGGDGMRPRTLCQLSLGAASKEFLCKSPSSYSTSIIGGHTGAYWAEEFRISC